MKLRFVWHILRKDARKLWWMITLTLALLARLVHFDSLRAFATPGSEEGWLNILLPLAWSFLIALAVMEDPVESDTPFWMTVPCKWPSLLAAKAAFCCIVIHVPYLIASALILDARGFPPSEYLTVLLSRQLVLLVLTSGSIALAAVVRDVTQFMAVAILLATAVAGTSMAWNRDSAEVSHIRHVLVFTIVMLPAFWIAIAQYARRSTSESRLVGIAAVVIAAAIWWSPRERFYGIEAIAYPAPASAGSLAVHLADNAEPPAGLRGSKLPLKFGMASVAIPIVVSGLRENARAHLFETGAGLIDAAGNGYPAEQTFGGQAIDPCCRNQVPFWQILSIDPAVYSRIGNVPVTLEGKLLVDYYHPANPANTRYGSTTAIAGLGRCSADVPVRDSPSDENLHVECESPNPLPAIEVKLADLMGDRGWSRSMGGSGRFMSYPVGVWLSPVSRQETYFRLIDEEHYTPLGGAWSVPREIVRSVRISIVPEFPEGIALVDVKLPGIRLNQFTVKP